MNNLKPINESSKNKTSDVIEQRAGLTSTLKTGTQEAKVAALAKFFEVDAKTVELAMAKDLTTLEKDLQKAISNDLKGGFRGSSGGALGSSTKLISKQKAINEILSSKKALTKDEITAIINRVKADSKLKAANAEAKLLGQEAGTAEKLTASGKKQKYNKKGNKKPSTLSKITTAIGEKLKGMVKGKWTWGRIVAWCAVLGISAAAVWWYFYSQDGPVPEDMPQNEPNDEIWGPCLTYLIKNQGAKIGTLNTGATVVTTVPNAEYPGGIQFYSNGRVFNLKTKDKGSWKCIGGAVKTQTNENMNKPKLNESIGQIVKRVLNERYLMEQSEDEIANDVEYMVDYLDVPVWGNDYNDIYDLLKKYQANGKFKQFSELYKETGFNKSDSLRGDIEAIKAIDAKPVLWKRKILDLLNQIETGRSVSSTNNTNTNTGGGSGFKMTTLKEQELQISWDKDKKTGGDGGNGGGNSGGGGGGNSGGGGGGGTTRKTYTDCSNINIETTPLTYGCKDQKIGQIQACLGILSDNKFGPNTLKALTDNAYDAKNGITKAIYDKVMAGCKKGSTAQTATSTEGGADVKYLRTPIKMDLGPVPQMPAKNTSTTSTAPAGGGMTDTEFFQSLLDKGYFNKTGIIGRYAYNGPALNPSDKEKIDNILINNYNYSPTVAEPTETGARYVWKRN